MRVVKTGCDIKTKVKVKAKATKVVAVVPCKQWPLPVTHLDANEVAPNFELRTSFSRPPFDFCLSTSTRFDNKHTRSNLASKAIIFWVGGCCSRGQGPRTF